MPRQEIGWHCSSSDGISSSGRLLWPDPPARATRRARRAQSTRSFEIEGFRVIEVDADGKLRAIVLFDKEDAAAAHTELFERYAAGGADGLPASTVALARALNDHDLGRVRAALPDGLVIHDHRRTGIGRLEGAAAWVDSVAALYELSPDLRVDELYQVATTPHGRVSVGRMWGSNTEGGDFESCFVRFQHYPNGWLLRAEIYEVEDLDTALARFEELGREAGAEDSEPL